MENTEATSPETRQYVAQFVKSADAAPFAEWVAQPGNYATEILYRKGRCTVTWTGPADADYHLSMSESVGYFGSPPLGRVATLNGNKTPRSY